MYNNNYRSSLYSYDQNNVLKKNSNNFNQNNRGYYYNKFGSYDSHGYNIITGLS